jgi:acyl-CoA-dependent ceramide synthase
MLTVSSFMMELAFDETNDRFVQLTYIGVAVYVTMDVSDIFLALAKCVNYVSEDASAPFFAFFVVVWT